MNEWAWAVSLMILIVKLCVIASLSTTNPTWIDLGLISDLAVRSQWQTYWATARPYFFKEGVTVYRHEMKTTDVIWTVRSDISRQGCQTDEIKNGVVSKEFVSLYGCILKQWRQCKLKWVCMAISSVILQNDKGVYVSCVKLYRRELGLRRHWYEPRRLWFLTANAWFNVQCTQQYCLQRVVRWQTGSELAPWNTAPSFWRRWWSRSKLFWEPNAHWRICIISSLDPLISCINSSHTSTPLLLQNNLSVFPFYL
jgi:hypothetical protein